MPADVAEANESGFSLLEVMVAVLVLSIAVVGLFRVFDQSVLSVASSEDRLLAGLVARNRAEELQLGLRDLPKSIRLADRHWLITTRTLPTTGGFEEIEIIVQPENGRGGSRLLTYREAGVGE